METVQKIIDDFVAGDDGRCVSFELLGDAAFQYGQRDSVVRPAASSVKPLLVATIFEMAHQGHISLNDQVSVLDLEPSFYVSILPGFDDNRSLSIRELCMFSIVTSDNSMSDYLFRLMNRDVLNEVQLAIGLQGEETISVGFADDMLGPASRANAISCNGSIAMLKHIRDMPQYRDIWIALSSNLRSYRLPALLPDHVKCAHKTGTLNGVVNDAGFVEADGFSYCLAIMTDGQSSNMDTSREIADVSLKIYEALLGA